MRNLCLALLVANLAFFGWTHWVDAPAPPATSQPAATLPTLALITPAGAPGSDGATSSDTASAATASAAASSATSSANALNAAPVGAAADAAQPGARCRSLGPFLDPAAALATAGALRARGLQPRDRSVDISSSDGYWVYIDHLAGAAAQQRALARLSAAGIRNGTALTAAGQADRISLGVFPEQARAVRRAEQVRELGFKPVLDLHQRTISQHWLDMDLKPGVPEPPLAQLRRRASTPLAAAADPEPEVAFSDCPASGQGG